MSEVVDNSAKVNSLRLLGFVPAEDFVSARNNWRVRCISCGESFDIQWASVKSGRVKGCPYCRPKKDGSKKKYSEKEAIELMRKYGRETLEPFTNAKRGWKSRCLKCGLVGSPSLSNILAKQRNSCMNCGQIEKGLKRRMSQQDARQLFLNKGVELISEYVPGEKVKIRCLSCGKASTSFLTNVYKVKNACGYCSKRIVDPLQAKEFMISRGYLPLVPYPLSGNKWKCQHIPCGRTVYPAYSDIKKGTGGCTSCAKHGFDLERNAYVYFIYHSDYDSYKVGIGNLTKYKNRDRLNKHILEGWDVLHVWHFEKGSDAALIETRFFEIIRKTLGIPVHLSPEEMPHGGWTETFSADSIDLPSIRRLLMSELRSIGKLS